MERQSSTVLLESQNLQTKEKSDSDEFDNTKGGDVTANPAICSHYSVFFIKN